MEYLGTVSQQVYQLSTCEIGGRYFCVTGESSILRLVEIKLGRRMSCICSPLGVQLHHGDHSWSYLYQEDVERGARRLSGASGAPASSRPVFDVGILSARAESDGGDYPGGWEKSPGFAYMLLSACRFGDRIFAFSLTKRKEPMVACIIDPFHDIYGQPIDTITENPPAVTVLELTGRTGQLDTGSPCWQLDERRVLYCSTGGSELYVFTLDLEAREMNISKHPKSLPGRMKYYTSFIQRRSGALIMFGGNKGEQCDSVYSVRVDADSIEKTSMKPFVGKARNSPGLCLCQDRFVIAFGGFTGSYVREFVVYDLETQNSANFTLSADILEPNQWSCMFLRDGYLYILGGAKNGGCHRISLSYLAQMIPDEELQHNFLTATGSQSPASKGPLPSSADLRAWYLGQYRTIMRTYFPSQPVPEPEGEIDFVSLYRAARAARAAKGAGRP